MKREEAIKIIDCYDIGFYDLSGENCVELVTTSYEDWNRTTNITDFGD